MTTLYEQPIGLSVPILEVGTLVRSTNPASAGKLGRVDTNTRWHTLDQQQEYVLYALTFEDETAADGYVRDRDFNVVELDFDVNDPDAVERFLNS